MDSESLDSTNCGSKIFEKKIPEISKKQNLNLLHDSNIFGEGNGNPSQYSCLVNPMGRGVWWATVNEVTKESDTT